MSKAANLYKKLHRWPGLILSFILLYYGITGIFMNHRDVFSGIDVSRGLLPAQYKYENWNNAALKGNLILSKDSILVYGNIGIWLTDSSFKQYTSFNDGFPKGSDNRKIFDVHRASDGNLYAATLFGLFVHNNALKQWQKFELNSGNERFTGIESIGDTLYAISRSHLFKGRTNGIRTRFVKIELKAPEGYKSNITLFETIWQIHSGEIMGLPGKLFVDLLGVLTAILSITGIIYFFFPFWIKRRFKRGASTTKIIKVNKWSLQWHNKLGAWTFVLLVILFFTGMFLRPPLLIAIARANVAPLKFSHLDQPNPWYDKLRDIFYDKDRGIMLLSTSEGMYFMDQVELWPARFQVQPPVSVMGINTFERYDNGAFLIGSFSGLFLWHPAHPEILNYAKGSVYTELSGGRPVGDYKVTGVLTDIHGRQYLADYDKGIIPLWHDEVFHATPANVLTDSRMSLWSVCLEIHTGRIFEGLMGMFYILLVPLIGLASVVLVISGYLLWRKKYRH